MRIKLLILIFILSVTAQCIKKVITYKGVRPTADPLKIQIIHYETISDQTIVKNDYFGNLLIVELKKLGANNIHFVDINPNLKIVFNDDDNYVSVRGIDQKGTVQFISVYSNNGGALGLLSMGQMRDIIIKLSIDIYSWIHNKKIESENK